MKDTEQLEALLREQYDLLEWLRKEMPESARFYAAADAYSSTREAIARLKGHVAADDGGAKCGPRVSMTVGDALHLVSRYAPCAHDDSDTNLGSGAHWARCHDCGSTFSQEAWDDYREAEKKFGEAMLVLNAVVGALSSVGGIEARNERYNLYSFPRDIVLTPDATRDVKIKAVFRRGNGDE